MGRISGQLKHISHMKCHEMRLSKTVLTKNRIRWYDLFYHATSIEHVQNAFYLQVLSHTMVRPVYSETKRRTNMKYR